MRQISDYQDARGLVTMKNGDGGDSLQKTCFYVIAMMIKAPSEGVKQYYSAMAKKLEVAFGVVVRNPGAYPWNVPTNTSRDNTVPLVIAAGYCGDAKLVMRMLTRLVLRGFTYQNNRVYGDPDKRQIPDIASPEHVAQHLRALLMCVDEASHLALMVLAPVVLVSFVLLLFTDLFMLLGSVSIILHSYLDKEAFDYADDDNHIISLYQARDSVPTPVSYLARKLYFKLRKRAGKTDVLQEDLLSEYGEAAPKVQQLNGPQSAVLWKHRAETGAPPLGYYWLSILDEA